MPTAKKVASPVDQTAEDHSDNGVTSTAVIPEVVKIGNLTRDPEMRFGQNGQAICETDLAVNPPKDSEAETQFYHLVMFRNLAENVAESLTKSDRVIVVGKPDIDVWQDKETNEPRSRKKIIVTSIGPDLRFATVKEVTKLYRTPTPPPSNVADLTNF